MEKSKSFLNSSSKKIIKYVSIIAVSLLLIIPVYLSCQSNAMEKKIEQSDKMLVIDWISGKLTEFYIDAETADQMTTHIKKQSKNDRYDEYTTVEQFIARLTKDLQGISKDMHLRLKINTNMPDSTTDGTEEAIPANIVGEKRKNFQFKEIKVLEGNVGYLRLDAFRNPKYAAPTAIAAMNFLANCDAVIFDLRYNGGGYAEMVQLILSYLFDEPVHYLNSYTRKDDRTDEWITHSEVSGPRMQDVLVYVLTGNKLTFSAAEEFAFALQNQKRATIVGEQTTGGGHGIDFFFLREYYIEFRIPTEKSADPKTGESWEISGIEPDVKCKSEQAFGLAYELALEALADQASGSRQNELEWLLEYQETLNKPFRIDSTALQNYAGSFGPVIILVNYDRLMIKLPNDNSLKSLHAVSETEFIIEGDVSSRVEFELDDDKAVALTGIRMDGLQMKFDRVEASAIVQNRKSRRESFKMPAKVDTALLSNMGIDFILVEGGNFEAGDIFGEGSRAEIPVHKITLDAFYMSKTEVTFAQYDQFCQATGKELPDDEGWGRNDRPVINISWYDAIDFCQWLSRKSGYFIDFPTEAEWEYAARERGKKIRFANGSDIADPKAINFNGDASEKKPYSVVGLNRESTLPVASFPPNSLGFHDMSGNVWEYCADWYDKEYYRNSPNINPAGSDHGQYRVIRGGSFAMGPAWMRNTTRAAWDPRSPNMQNGFRLIMLP